MTPLLLAADVAEKFMPDMPAAFYVPALGAMTTLIVYQEAQKKFLQRIVFKALKVVVPDETE